MSSLLSDKSVSRTTGVVSVVLAAWLALVFILGATGAFVTTPGQPPIRIVIGVTAPLVVFLIAFGMLRGFREYILALDLRLATAIQAWRAAGMGFLALYVYGILPGSFAWPAGLGDIAIGVTAPWVLLALLRRPGFANSSPFVAWNLFGIADLVVAVGSGGLGSLLATGAAGEITTAPMALLPLVLIPAFLVPVFIMLHLAALFQARRSAATDHAHDAPHTDARFARI
jgi:hypothetical protein